MSCSSAEIIHNICMAHLIKLHTAGQNQEIVFNLDTLVSAERNGNYTAISTRWGYQNVKETLNEILDQAGIVEGSVKVGPGGM